jgi:hypothetical protein
VDITFPNNASEVHAVYGIFEARVNTHFDIDQQLSRVRNPGEVNVWISPEKFRFSIDPRVIKDEVRKTEQSTRQLIKIEDDGTLVYNEHDDYLDLYANVKAMQRGSKNDLRYHFRKLKEHYGWKIVDVKADKKSVMEGSELLELGDVLRDAAVRKKIQNAKLITRREYTQLDQLNKMRKLNSDHHYAMRCYEIESFYYQEVTDDLIMKDRDGQYRREIRMYEIFTADDSDLIVRDRSEIDRKTHATDRKTLMEKKRFLHELLAVAGLSDDEHHILTEKRIEGDFLEEFVRFCRQHQERIAYLFSVDVRKDIAKKPAQQLSQFLSNRSDPLLRN